MIEVVPRKTRDIHYEAICVQCGMASAATQHPVYLCFDCIQPLAKAGALFKPEIRFGK